MRLLPLALLALLAAPADAKRSDGAPPRGGPGVSAESKYSAKRDRDESFEHARDAFWRKVKGIDFAHQGPTPQADFGALQVAVPLERLDLSGLPRWKDTTELALGFARLRDARPLEGPEGFARRLTWLYPDDGCYARAAMMAGMAEKRGMPRPKKVFIFGELEVQTSNAPGGSVSWWYHVAPIVSVGGEAYVIDPAIEPARPLRLSSWVERMKMRSSDLKLAICSEHAYVPSSPCQSAAGADLESAANIRDFLPREWTRVADLGREPRMLLGDSPPWVTRVAGPGDAAGRAVGAAAGSGKTTPTPASSITPSIP